MAFLTANEGAGSICVGGRYKKSPCDYLILSLGEEEKRGCYLLLKDMASGMQRKVSINEL